jgi:hypothetical protein
VPRVEMMKELCAHCCVRRFHLFKRGLQIHQSRSNMLSAEREVVRSLSAASLDFMFFCPNSFPVTRLIRFLLQLSLPPRPGGSRRSLHRSRRIGRRQYCNCGRHVQVFDVSGNFPSSSFVLFFGRGKRESDFVVHGRN